MNLKGKFLIITGLVVLIFVIGSISVLENSIGHWSLWIMAIGFPAGGFFIVKGREILGLKNKNFGENKADF